MFCGLGFRITGNRSALAVVAAVFHNEVDRRAFVQTLAEACAKTDWQVHAYYLMKRIFIWWSKTGALISFQA